MEVFGVEAHDVGLIGGFVAGDGGPIERCASGEDGEVVSAGAGDLGLAVIGVDADAAVVGRAGAGRAVGHVGIVTHCANIVQW